MRYETYTRCHRDIVARAPERNRCGLCASLNHEGVWHYPDWRFEYEVDLYNARESTYMTYREI